LKLSFFSGWEKFAQNCFPMLLSEPDIVGKFPDASLGTARPDFARGTPTAMRS